MARRADLLSDRPDPMALSEETLVRLMLEAAAPLLAEAVAEKILAHMESHGPQAAALPYVTDPGFDAAVSANLQNRTWRRHFSIAAQVASLAFSSREDQMRMAAGAVERGDFIACNPPEVPGEH